MIGHAKWKDRGRKSYISSSIQLFALIPKSSPVFEFRHYERVTLVVASAKLMLTGPESLKSDVVINGSAFYETDNIPLQLHLSIVQGDHFQREGIGVEKPHMFRK